ncbi:glutathione S-transferase C-terminal domain-containing protein [Phytobacter sp. V91]|uniref:glutathione S-transferase C-terminal domain-containing protein n=1 Tax=Phytobacter sp. V91 TaxID=3369425 RepID=UPI003F6088A9
MTAITKFKTFAAEIKQDGAFVQQANLFTQKFGDAQNEWPVEANRYRLLWMPACPHAHKVVIVRKLLGLDRVISLGATGPWRTEKGWEFSRDPDYKDPVLGIRYIHDVYIAQDPDFTGRPTVPIMVDTVTGKGVNNDHYWLTIYLETAWKKYHYPDAPDLYPDAQRQAIDALNEVIYQDINLGVYKAGFAHTQNAYNDAYDRLFARLDEFEERLSTQRYLLGSQLTDADLRLFPTLARFDSVYYPLFRTNRNRLVDYKHLWAYARDIYQIPAVKESTDFAFIKESYFRSPHLAALFGNIHNLLPKGSDLAVWEHPHGRNT